MRAAIACVLLGLLGAPGCEAPIGDEGDVVSEDYRSHNSCRRPNEYPTLLALGDLDLSGTPSISGYKPRLAANGNVTIAGSAEIEADIFAGGGLYLEGNPSIDGETGTLSHTLQVSDDATMDFVRDYNNNWRIPCVVKYGRCNRYLSGTELSLNDNETLTLRSGSYYFSDIQINGNAALKTNGNVWVFLDGDANFNGGATSNTDYDTLTLVTNGDHTITINGAASAAMHVFAPHAEVKLAGTSGFAGSVIAEDIVLSGTTDLYLTPGSLAKNCPPLDGRYDK